MPCSELDWSRVSFDFTSDVHPVAEVDSVTLTFAGFTGKFRHDGNFGLGSESGLFLVFQPLHHLVALCLAAELHSLGSFVAPQTNRLVNCNCNATSRFDYYASILTVFRSQVGVLAATHL